MSNNLFRKEVLEHKRSHTFSGETALPNTFSLKILICILFILFIGIFAFITFGSYTERRTVSGYLTPITGIVKVSSPIVGTIEDLFIKEGDVVEKNQSLALMRNQQYGSQGDYNYEIRKNLNERLILLQEKEPLITQDFADRKQIAFHLLQDAKNQSLKNTQQINTQIKKVALAKSNLTRYTQGLTDGAISQAELQLVQEKILELELYLNTLEERRDSLSNNIKTKQLEYNQLNLTQQKEMSELKTQISTINQSILEIDKQVTTKIVAPVSGKVTSINNYKNQSITPSKPLLSIIPNNSKLKATLLIPPGDIGFIKVSDPVSIRYQAFPYQKYGQAKGHITSISKTTVLINDLVENSGFSLTNQSNKSVYLVDIELDQQSMHIDGHDKALETGMTLDADIKLENRKLYQWILEPLISLKERNS